MERIFLTREERKQNMYNEIYAAAKDGVSVTIYIHPLGLSSIEFSNPYRRYFELNNEELRQSMVYLDNNCRKGIFGDGKIFFEAKK